MKKLLYSLLVTCLVMATAFSQGFILNPYRFKTPAPTYVAAASTPENSASTSWTINYPTVQANDILIAILQTDTTHGLSGTVPAGWTLVYSLSDTNSNDSSSAVFWKRATGSEGSSEAWTGIFNDSEIGIAVVMAYRGCTTSVYPFDVANAEVDPLNTTLSISGTTAVANTVCLAIFCFDPNEITKAITWNAPATDRINNATTPSGINSTLGFIGVGEVTQAVPEPVTPSGTIASNEASNQFFLALKP